MSSDDNEWLWVQSDVYLFAGFFHLRVPESSAVGSAVGRIKAHDLDIGKNAEVEYTIVPGDGGAMFDITTNEHNQEGIIILKRVWSSHSLINSRFSTFLFFPVMMLSENTFNVKNVLT